jgi:putative membrane protein insertion efficiency factor
VKSHWNRHWNPIGTLLVWVIRGYQTFISPALKPSCKYYPSCSQYAVEALRHYGVLRGLVLAAWRLLRCNPLSYGGYDPVERQTVFVSRMKVGRGCGCTGHGSGLGIVEGSGPPSSASVDRGAPLAGVGGGVQAGRVARC